MSTLGGGSTLGGAPKQPTTLGGAAKATTLGGAPKATTLGGGATLGAPKATGSALGAPAKPATTLGGGATLGGGSTLGATLGAKPTAAAPVEEKPKDEEKKVVDEAAGDDSGDDADNAGGASSSAAAKKKKKKKPAKKAATEEEAPAPAAKKGVSKISALAEKLRREKEERERIEREEKEEEERLEKEALAAEKRAAEKEVLEKERIEQQRIKDKAAAEERKKQDAVAKRAAMLAKFSGAVVAGVPKDESAAPSAGATAAVSAASKKKTAKERKQMASDAQARAEQAKADAAAAEAAAAAAAAKPAVKSSWDDSSDEEDEEEEKPEEVSTEAVATATGAKKADETLRSPIACVLGHVDTGKTKLLDKMRNTNVQDGEVGGITQQIGATYFPMDTIREIMGDMSKDKLQFKVPGLLIMDTPGHASFANMRSRGSSLCDIAILVVDIMHGLEPMTIESINLLKMRNTRFIVALNKVDRLFEWKAHKNKNIQFSLKNQAAHVMREYQERVNHVIAQFAEQNLNADLYYNLKKLKDYEATDQVPLVPTSAHTGEGIPDLLSLVVQLSQLLMAKRLESTNQLKCTVLEVKELAGHGTTIDVILADGELREGDRILLCGLSGPIDTHIRALLTPPPLRELRIKDKYMHHKVIHAAQGLKISAPGLDKALAGSQLFVVKSEQEVDELLDIVMKPLQSLRDKIPKSSTGVYVQASTLGSLEALLDFLTTICKIPIAEFGVGPIHLKDVKMASVMLERNPDYACILAFDVNISPEARELANSMKVRLFEADIIYHLEKMFKDHIDALAEAKRSKAKSEAIFPCLLTIKPDAIFHTRDPITLGVTVKAGVIRVGTPISVYDETNGQWLDLGRIVSAQRDHKPVEEVKQGDEAAISIVAQDGQQKYLFGRHFTEKDELVSRISRASLDALKEHFAELCKTHFSLLKRLKVAFVDTEGLVVKDN